MKFNPDIHHRQSIRLKDYDYSQEGAYFVTICCQNKECLFGEILNGVTRLNKYGKIVGDEWLKSADIRSEIELDEFIIMPNHIHGISAINGIVAINCRGDRPPEWNQQRKLEEGDRRSPLRDNTQVQNRNPLVH